MLPSTFFASPPGGVQSSSWPTTGISMRLYRIGVSPALRAGASDFGKTQSHQRSSPPPIRSPSASALASVIRPTARADGPSMARRHSLDIPVSRPGLMASPRRIRGGTNTVPDCGWVGSLLLCWPLRGAQNGGCPNICCWMNTSVSKGGQPGMSRWSRCRQTWIAIWSTTTTSDHIRAG